MRTSRLLLPALLLALAAAPASAQDDVDRVARLIRDSMASPAPMVAFLAGFKDLGDVDLDQAELRAAMQASGIPADPATEAFLGQTRALKKRGARIELKRDAASTFPMGAGALKLAKDSRFDLTMGDLAGLGGDDRRRLAAADPAKGYVRLSEIEGIEVGESANKLYNLYEMFYVEEGGRPVVHIKAGIWLHKEWRRIELPAPAANEVTAAAPAESLPSAPEDGLPLDLATRVAPADLAARDEPVATTLPVTIEAPAGVDAAELTEVRALDPADEVLPVTLATDAAAPVTTQQGPETAETEGLTSRLDGIAQGRAPITSQADAAPSADRPLEDGGADVVDADQAAQAGAPRIEEPRLESGVENAETAAVASAATAEVPAGVTVPEPEERERIDDAVAATQPDLDAFGQQLAELREMIRRDQAEAERRMEAQIARLNEQTERIREEVARLSQRIDALEGGRTRGDFAPRRLDSVSGPRLDGRRPLGDMPRGGLSRGGLDRRPMDGSLPVATPREEKPSVWERLLMKVLEGIEKGLQQRYAGAAAANLDARADALAVNTAPANRGYVDYRFGDAVANSSLGPAIGAPTYGAIPITGAAPVRGPARPAAQPVVDLPLGYDVVPLRRTR